MRPAMGRRRHQALRIGMAGRAADIRHAALLDEAAEIHDAHRVRHVLNER